MEDSAHFRDMLERRGIPRDWVNRAESPPDKVEDHGDGTRRFLKQIPENANRWLRVVVNVTANPPRRITVFFDRRQRREP